MNRNAALITLVTLTTPLWAIAGTVEFSGEIIEKTCEVTTGATAINVPFGKIDASQLSTGTEAGHAAFSVNLTCTASVGAKVATQFGSANLADPVTGNLKLDGSSSARNVQIAIYNHAGEKQHINQVPTAASWKDVTAGNLRLDYIAAVRAEGGNAEKGNIKSQATFTVVYQ